MAKSKQFSRVSKKPPKRQTQVPETADEYLAAGVLLQEAGEKWRAGDAAKSARFFGRAVENYDRGLSFFPSSFDLAYNKAQVQYQVTQYPALWAHTSTSLADLLKSALESHRRALHLDPTNADILFNTAQVLTSLAETVVDQNVAITSVDSGATALTSAGLLEEAIALFQQCLVRQEVLYSQRQELTHALPPTDNDDFIPGAPSWSSIDGNNADMQHGKWALIEEPVTRDSLIDTALALLEALAALCGFVNRERSLVNIDRTAQSLLKETVAVHMQGLDDDKVLEVHLTNARFKALLLEAQFRETSIDLNTYNSCLADIFKTNSYEPIVRSLLEHLIFLCAHADAVIAFNAATAGRGEATLLRWTNLTKGLECLIQAVRSPNARDATPIHLGQGDMELLRFSLCSGSGLPQDLTNDEVKVNVLKGAQTYYRSAARSVRSDIIGQVSPNLTEAIIKEATVTCLAIGSNDFMKTLQAASVTDSDIKSVLAEMMEESLVSQQALHECGLW